MENKLLFSLTYLSVIILTMSIIIWTKEAKAQQVIIEVNNTATDQDDYLCWSPISARAKLASESPNPVEITLVSQGDATAGSVHFQEDSGSRPTLQTFSPQPELSLQLQGDRSWTSFWVSGARRSIGEKDIQIVAQDSAGGELGKLPVMVRVRKNAEAMTDVEIGQFLHALAQVHDLSNGAINSQWIKHVRAHDEAFFMGIHGAPSGLPLFLAWHRAFLLNLERELQAIDLRVTLPYWRFDQPAPKLFTPDFLGSVSGSGGAGSTFLVEFSRTNPLRGWQMGDGRGGLVRARNGSSSAPIPANRLELLFGDPNNVNYGAINGAIENSYHNRPHGRIGGWLASRASPRDPLFFLLHANVDRAWAHWQSRFNKFDETDVTAYSATGHYPSISDPARFRQGSYAQDVMWPWTGVGGDQGTPDPLDDWPVLAYLMPNGSGPTGLVLPPTPASQVDYLGANGRDIAHGTCYDDIDFQGRTIPTP